MAKKKLSTKELVDLLKDPAKAESGLTLVGMVKLAEKSEDSVMFTPSDCDHWIQLPLSSVDEIEHIGNSPCKDHTHVVVRLALKAPTSPEGRLLQGLIRAITQPRESTAAPGHYHVPNPGSSGPSNVICQPCYNNGIPVSCGETRCQRRPGSSSCLGWEEICDNGVWRYSKDKWCC